MPQPARLTSSLLARKGQALPAAGFSSRAVGAVRPGLLEVVGGRAEPGVAGLHHGPSGHSDRRVAMTVRLDRERHVRLKVFAALHDLNCQDVLIEALDAYLQACGADCACMGSGKGRPADA
jgi:hypothetical protein